MKPTFDDTNFPWVNINFGSSIDSDEEFNEFIEKWDVYNNNKIDYNLIFNCLELSYMKPKFVNRIRSFDKELKSREKVYIKNSILLVSSKFIRGLIHFVFKMQKPVSNIYLVNSEQDALLVKYCINNSIKIDTNKITMIKK